MVYQTFDQYYDDGEPPTIFGIQMTRRGCELMAHPRRETVRDFQLYNQGKRTARKARSGYTYEYERNWNRAQNLFNYHIINEWLREATKGTTIVEYIQTLSRYMDLAETMEEFWEGFTSFSNEVDLELLLMNFFDLQESKKVINE